MDLEKTLELADRAIQTRVGCFDIYNELKTLFKDFICRMDISATSTVFKCYDLLVLLKWGGTGQLSDLSELQEEVCDPFAQWLDLNYPAVTLIPAAAPTEIEPTKISFFTVGNTDDTSDAVPRVLASLIRGITIGKSKEVKIFVYALNGIYLAFKDKLERLGCTVVDFSEPANTRDKVDAVCRRVLCDRPNVLVADNNRALTAACFSRLIGARKIYLDYGIPYSAFKGIDLMIRCLSDENSHTLESHYRGIVRLQARIDRSYLIDVATANAQHTHGMAQTSEGGLVFGCYGRLIKVTEGYLSWAKKLLEKEPTFKLYIAGTGDISLINRFFDDDKIRNRLILNHGFTRPEEAHKQLDVFFDTFPFMGGLSCLEAQMAEIPVVWKRPESAYKEFLTSQRDVSTCVRDSDEFVELVSSMSASERYRSYRLRAKEIALRSSDTQAYGIEFMQQVSLLLNQAKRGGYRKDMSAIREKLGII